MDNYMPMSTTKRHNNIVTSLILKLGALIEKKEINVLHDQCSLVYWGTKTVIESLSLVNISKIEDLQKFKETVIEDLYCAQPDFMLFKDNPYIENKRQTRTAGQPDLIVEIWSEGNTKNDKDFLKYLYSTSDITEHWYIEQDSNRVECYLGKKKLHDQYLTNVLITQKGLEFDLGYLAI